ERTSQIGVAVNSVRRQPGAGIEHHEPPHGVLRIDRTDVGPDALTIDRDEKGGGLASTCLQQSRHTEVKMHCEPERFVIETDCDLLADHAVRPIASDQVFALNVLRSACFEIDNLRAHATWSLLKGFKTAPVAQTHGRKRASESLKNRVEPHLRADL